MYNPVNLPYSCDLLKAQKSHMLFPSLLSLSSFNSSNPNFLIRRSLPLWLDFNLSLLLHSLFVSWVANLEKKYESEQFFGLKVEEMALA